MENRDHVLIGFMLQADREKYGEERGEDDVYKTIGPEVLAFIIGMSCETNHQCVNFLRSHVCLNNIFH